VTPEEIIELHRNGGTCAEWCGRRATVVYRCVGCENQFYVIGYYKWHAQGRNHFHEPENKAAFEAMKDHLGRRDEILHAVLPFKELPA
jgi:quinol monooxygenase YgiN